MLASSRCRSVHASTASWNLETVLKLKLSKAVDVILAWLVAEDEGAKSKIQDVLSDRDETLQDLRATLQGTPVSKVDHTQRAATLTLFRSAK